MEDLLSLKDLTKNDIESIFQKTKETKGIRSDMLAGRCLAMIFEKPSTRTRVSFESGMTQLGGHAIFLNPTDTQLGRGESVADTARVLSGYVDAIMARLFKHEVILELARHSSVPVINGLTDFSHPCQVLADLFTLLEKKGTLDLKIAWLGDGNNVCNSFVFAASRLGFPLSIAAPDDHRPRALKMVNSQNITLEDSPQKAVEGADVIVTDTWTSMGQEKEKEERIRKFRPFQVNRELASHAEKDYVFLHCLPAYRGYEVTEEIIDGPHSLVWDEAENRLHVQKAILISLLS